MSKPTFIFVPGAWHSPDIFSPLMPLLSKHGYNSHALALPSVGASPGLPSFSEDVAALQLLIKNTIADSKDIVVVLWSYGSQVGSEGVLPEMLKPAREKEGKKGGVVRLVYLAAPILPIGMSVEASRGPPPPDAPKVVHIDEDAGTMSFDPEFAGMQFYNDVPDLALVARLVAGLRSMSLGAVRSPLTRAAWEYTPCTVVICENDMGLPKEALERQLKEAKSKVPGAFDTVERCGAGHAPFVSMSEWVVEVLRRAAGEDV